MFLKKKRDGTIKARGCAEGKTHWITQQKAKS